MSKLRVATVVPPILLWIVLSGCGARSNIIGDTDCLEDGTCECRDSTDCPVPNQCVNGFCRTPRDGGSFLQFGEPCDADVECASGFCIPTANGIGKVCTRFCTGTCPENWTCKVRVGSPDVSLCAQNAVDRTCSDCSVHGHCNPAFGDYCISLGGIESCGLDCNYQACPTGYVCTSISVLGGMAKQCVPVAATCACTSATVGLKRPCDFTNAFGTCTGTTECLANHQWAPCPARVPALEVCNGIDDDCNGLVDTEDPGIDTSQLPWPSAYPSCMKQAGGSCSGTWACQAGLNGYEWVCAADDPSPEICDGLDNDCDGTVDGPFLDDQGRYATIGHCGKCNVDCRSVVTNAATGFDGQVLPDAVKCEFEGDVAVCLPVKCAPGFYPFPQAKPVQCRPLPSPQCRACTTVTDCSVPNDVCARVGHDFNKSCLQACGADALYPGCTGALGTQGCCPDMSLCLLVDGAKVCVPRGDSCECDAEHLMMQRSCVVTGEDGAKCEGRETCWYSYGGSLAWSDCKTTGVTDEVCDGLDNNCDGRVDETFINMQGTGTYDVDKHCGACHIDCTAMWSPTIQHAIGGCVGSKTKPPTCEIVACSKEIEYIPGGTPCQLSSDCKEGWNCEPPYYHCTRYCTTDAECPSGSSCQHGFCAVPCTTPEDCAEAFGYSSCNNEVCAIPYLFHNADKLDANGCECPARLGETQDQPEVFATYPEAGAPYIDSDCDGIDGTESLSLFVWQGTDLSFGTKLHPYRTIAEAINAFNPSIHRYILVASGEYHEAVELKPGVRLYGGYAPGFGSRDILGYPTLIIGPELPSSDASIPQATIRGSNLSGGILTDVAGFAIYAADINTKPAAGAAGRTSYAIHLLNSNNAVRIANNMIMGARGGDGGHGIAGQPGAAGKAGSNGLNSKECKSASCAGETQPGGAAGTNASCTAGTSGNAGASANGNASEQGYYSPLGLNGKGGTNATYNNANHYQFSNLCKYDCTIAGDVNGQDASSGGNGSTGNRGNGCASEFGSVVGGLWRPGSATAGGAGTVGVGGGGGGAGGCVPNINPNTCSVGNLLGDLGATGGGGGAGGCGGAGGRAGGSGGGSFGIFVGFTSPPGAIPQIWGNIIYLGQGGAGGDGAYGGHGGLGGTGGSGGVSTTVAWCGGPGGKGGRGGDGGPGGGAGGGCGGVAFAIAGNYIGSASYLSNNVFVNTDGAVGGPGGSGGPSPAGGTANGTAGVSGKAGVIHVY